MGMAADGGPGGGLSAGVRRTFVALGYREYLLFWVGAAFSNLGIWALFAGRLWLMHELTESPVMLGLVTVSSSGPILLLSMWGGVVADRVNRLRLVTVTRAMFAGIALLTALLIATGPDRAVAHRRHVGRDRHTRVVRHPVPAGDRAEPGAPGAPAQRHRAVLLSGQQLRRDRTVDVRPDGRDCRPRGPLPLRRGRVRADCGDVADDEADARGSDRREEPADG